MTSMDDLISSLNGGMHVSQEGYDLQALQVCRAKPSLFMARYFR